MDSLKNVSCIVYIADVRTERFTFQFWLANEFFFFFLKTIISGKKTTTQKQTPSSWYSSFKQKNNTLHCDIIVLNGK